LGRYKKRVAIVTLGDAQGWENHRAFGPLIAATNESPRETFWFYKKQGILFISLLPSFFSVELLEPSRRD